MVSKQDVRVLNMILKYRKLHLTSLTVYMEGNVRILTWNVESIRSAIKKGFWSAVSEVDPDFLLIQETTLHKRVKYKQSNLCCNGYTGYFHHAKEKAYAGVAIYTKYEPLSAQSGLSGEFKDEEGRVLTLEFEDYFLMVVYCPFARQEFERLDFKISTFMPALLNEIQTLNAIKPVILGGDLNLTHQEIDSSSSSIIPSCHPRERLAFRSILDIGMIDAFRSTHPNDPGFTFPFRNTGGVRIDYILFHQNLNARVVEARVLTNYNHSDHNPLCVDFSLGYSVPERIQTSLVYLVLEDGTLDTKILKNTERRSIPLQERKIGAL